MKANHRAETLGLLEFLDASPTPFHACAESARLLEASGFQRVEEAEAWSAGVERAYTLRSGSIVAFARGRERKPHAGFRVIGAHTDSPNLRIKARPNTASAGWRQLGVEVYGGVLLNSWLDRDLGLAGRVMLRGKQGAQARLVRVDRPILVVPQLAIHLDREVNERGLVLDKQAHLAPVWALGRAQENDLQSLLAAELGVREDDLLSFDLMLFDTLGAALVGRDEEFIASARLDNLDSCWCALRALLRRMESGPPAHDLVVVLFDHEEVGSTSARGASSPLLRDVLERLVHARGGSREDFLRAVAGSFCVSADMAHAVHPNYRERYEPEHWVQPNAGPVIKINTSMRYATDAEGEALFALACQEAGVPCQRYVHRSNLACGTTIGPLTAANLGLRTVDVGNAELAMHSCRELAGADDPEWMIRALAAFLA